ncbi:flagellin [Sinisalibacter aestuarii]|uniref:Flagellar hook protein FlgL n=1 Tax=Sinisalibacter aestuarii TaxID=2949426 RepID=A0ABQ5LNU2_9RHOB|nr:flagellin [Sinisalibacter aestuarii]GKY86669.1 flagellar hook protein FlgL [Sinisalibacter aestuarii]
MSLLSIGDLANTFLSRRQSAGLKDQMMRLGTELTTGLRSDPGTALRGDYRPLAAIERSLTALAAYTSANTEAAGMLGAAQLALEHVQGLGQGLGTALLAAGTARDATSIAATAGEARQSFSAAVAGLNTRYGDRALFGGAATDRSPLASGEAMLAELVAVASGETSAAGIAAAVDAWFDIAGGGFDTMAYRGSASDLGPLAIAEGESVAIGMRADDTVLRDTLKGFALAALIAEGVLAGDPDEQAALVADAGRRMIANDGDLTGLRADLGAAEARIEAARARNASEAAAYDLARVELIGADPYQTASELEAVYAQIETLYTVTARIAGLTFTDYMR